jgi:anti-sigma regulatory factor (Ser/Thr protein kinase)
MPGPGTQATCSYACTPAIPDKTPAAIPGEAPAAGSDGQPGESPARSLVIPGRADQVPKARAFIARTLGASGLNDKIACLLGSELVTNAVQHSNSRLPGGTVTVTVEATDGILVEVTDAGGSCLPILRDGADPCAENGRGLLLVAALSARWGYQRGHGGLTTWFQIPAEPARLSLERIDQDRFMPIHSAEPAAETFRASDGQHADLFNLRHYPVHAICQVCGGEIETDSFLLPFVHIEETL